MIISPCINTGTRYYTGEGHLKARANACLCECIEMKDTRDFKEGYLSDTKDYKARTGEVYYGFFRDRYQAFQEALECGQLRCTKQEDCSGIPFGGLDSTKVMISDKMFSTAEGIAKNISAHDVIKANENHKQGNINDMIEYYR